MGKASRATKKGLAGQIWLARNSARAAERVVETSTAVGTSEDEGFEVPDEEVAASVETSTRPRRVIRPPIRLVMDPSKRSYTTIREPVGAISEGKV